MKLFAKRRILPNGFKLRYLYVIVLLIAVVSFSYLGFFLYKYIYLTFGMSEKIVFLRNEIAPDSINMAEVKTVINYIDQKGAIKKINRSEVKNPFQPLPAIATPPNPATATST